MGTIFVDNIKDNVGGKEVIIGDGFLMLTHLVKLLSKLQNRYEWKRVEVRDADADTSITVDTDDNIDFGENGADHMKFTGSELRVGKKSI